MVQVLGFDIGGANTKVAFLKTQNAQIQELKTLREYFPVWKNKKTQLPRVLKKVKKSLVKSTIVDGLGITITAELSDAYMTKKEGINHVLDSITEVFRYEPTFVLDVDANLLEIEDARRNSLMVSSANWVATGWLISQINRNCIIIDVGSTTTSMIPIINGKISTEGKTDLEKLQKGELIYSGSLRTNIATIVNAIPIRGNMTRVSSELFSQSGDIHLLLDNIKKQEYSTETCDNRGKTKREAAARLARVVCADMDMLTKQEILDMAKYVYDKQVEQITAGLRQLCERFKPLLRRLTVIVTGLGRNFLARKAAEKLGFEDIVDLGKLLGSDAAVMSPSVGVALMVANMLEGKTIKWKQY